jgi:hypothetical protein
MKRSQSSISTASSVQSNKHPKHSITLTQVCTHFPRTQQPPQNSGRMWHDASCVPRTEMLVANVHSSVARIRAPLLLSGLCSHKQHVRHPAWPLTGDGKGKGRPTTGYEGPEGEWRYSSTLFLTSPPDGVGGQHHAPAALPRGETPYLLYRMLCGPQDRSGRMPPPALYNQMLKATF